jgi:V8-like Glu-specific endopeptidase
MYLKNLKTLILATFVMSSVASAEENLCESVLSASVVKVSVSNETPTGTQTESGSGVLVARDYVLTAEHVANPMMCKENKSKCTILVQTSSDSTPEMKAIFIKSITDSQGRYTLSNGVDTSIAVLRVERSQKDDTLGAFLYENVLSEIKDRLCVNGFDPNGRVRRIATYDQPYQLADGTATDLVNLKTTETIDKGISGSGVFTADGKLAAIMFAEPTNLKITVRPLASFLTALSEIIPGLKSFIAPEPHTWLGLRGAASGVGFDRLPQDLVYSAGISVAYQWNLYNINHLTTDDSFSLMFGLDIPINHSFQSVIVQLDGIFAYNWQNLYLGIGGEAAYSFKEVYFGGGPRLTAGFHFALPNLESLEVIGEGHIAYVFQGISTVEGGITLGVRLRL